MSKKATPTVAFVEDMPDLSDSDAVASAVRATAKSLNDYAAETVKAMGQAAENVEGASAASVSQAIQRETDWLRQMTEQLNQAHASAAQATASACAMSGSASSAGQTESAQQPEQAIIAAVQAMSLAQV